MTASVIHLNTFTQEELDDLTEKCYAFIEMMCFAPPATGFYPYQEEFAKAIIKHILSVEPKTLTGLFARQSGKSETVANIGAGMMVLLPKLANLRDGDGKFIYPQLRNFVGGYKIGIFAPSNLQSTTTYSRLRDRIVAMHARVFLDSAEFALEGYNSLWPPLANSREFLQLNNGSLCMQMTADKNAKIESKTYHLILLDESQDLDFTVVAKSIMPMGAHTGATSVMTGTPGTTKGYFYAQIATNKREQIPKKAQQKHFEYDYRTVQKYNENYRKYILEEKKRIGQESDEFQQAYCLKWLLERGMAVPESLFDELTDRHRNIETTHKETPLVAGLDWGKGQDSTVLTIGKPLWDQVDQSGRCPVEVIYWWEKLGDNYEEIVADLKEQLKSFSVQTIACDATGVGEPLVDRLTWELPHITVLPIKFSSQSKDHLYKWFLLMLQEKKCTWPGFERVRARKYWKKFRDEMTNLVKEYKGQYLACHHPEDQKNAHDDFPDSLALMLWCINEEAMPFVEVSSGEFYKNEKNWHNNRGQGWFGRSQAGFSLHGT